jgi:hypothetical protein
MALQEFDDSTGPELADLAQAGYVALVGSTTYQTSLEYFPLLVGWDKLELCNKLECLETRVANSIRDGLDFEYLSYDPERLGGVPDEEKYNLPWATEQAREIADQAGKKLAISYSTKQLHQEAEERGFGWENAGEVVNLLAPYGDLWVIQAADEYNSPYENPDNPEPILSQRHFPPGAEWRAEVEKWVGWIKAANPDIEIWIQLALHRIPGGAPPWEDNYPSADLLLEYREWLVNPQFGPPLVDGVYISSIYSWPIDPIVADQEMEKVFHLACTPGALSALHKPALVSAMPLQSPRGSVDSDSSNPSSELIKSGDAVQSESPSAAQDVKNLASDSLVAPSGAGASKSLLQSNITLVEEGWTDDLQVAGITVLPGYYYRVYENSAYPCGAEGNHQFVVLDSGTDPNDQKHLFVKFLGGGLGFWYYDVNGNRVYYPHQNAVGLLNESLNYNWMFRTSVSEEYANGVTKRFRENESFRMLIVSYCSHDLYHGRGEDEPSSSVDGFQRYGYVAAMDAVDYVQKNYGTGKIITYGGSAGASGSFYIGKDQENVAGIIMDSMSVDLSAIRDACLEGNNVFGREHSNYPCCCPQPDPYDAPWCPDPYRTTCMEVVAPRIGFSFGSDEPYRILERGEVNTPIFMIWNNNDASLHAGLLYWNLHNALQSVNPAGASVACRVCLPNADPETLNSCLDDSLEPLAGSCNLHVPSGQDDEEYTTWLVDEVYNWALARVRATEHFDYEFYLPLVMVE